MGYPVVTLTEDGSTSQMRFLSLATEERESEVDSSSSTTWTIPVKVVWEGCDAGDELVVMLSADGGGDGDKELKGKLEELTAAGKWFKVCAVHGVASKTSTVQESD